VRFNGVPISEAENNGTDEVPLAANTFKVRDSRVIELSGSWASSQIATF
jgi:hypothetical protein